MVFIYVVMGKIRYVYKLTILSHTDRTSDKKQLISAPTQIIYYFISGVGS